MEIGKETSLVLFPVRGKMVYPFSPLVLCYIPQTGMEVALYTLWLTIRSALISSIEYSLSPGCNIGFFSATRSPFVAQ